MNSKITTNETLDELVREFQASNDTCCDDDEFYKCLPSLEDAIRNAALALTANGAISSHQRQWVDRESMQKASEVLLTYVGRIEDCKDFDGLLELIEKILRGVVGLGDLYCYDTSRRIGAFLGLFPKRVYLHRGTKDGAKALGLDHTKRYLNMVNLPIELRILEPKQIEDFLCRYKDRLKSIRR